MDFEKVKRVYDFGYGNDFDNQLQQYRSVIGSKDLEDHLITWNSLGKALDKGFITYQLMVLKPLAVLHKVDATEKNAPPRTLPD